MSMGERARRIGIEGESKAWDFLRALGYQILELNNEKYNIDCLARFPNKTCEKELCRPCYSPEGLTAFEITAKERLQKRKILDFESKIARYNANHPNNRIAGGVLLVDQKISNSMSEFTESKHIFAWGSNRQSLYGEKIRLFREWRKHFYVRHIYEIPLDKMTTYLRCSTPPPTQFDELFHYAIFCDNQFKSLQVKDVVEIMERVKEKLVPFVEYGVEPLKVYFEFHVLGGVSARLEDVQKAIVSPWADEGILVNLPVDAFKDYQTFPTLRLQRF